MTQVLEFHSEEAVQELSRYHKSSESSACSLPGLTSTMLVPTAHVKSPESNWQSSHQLGGWIRYKHNTSLFARHQAASNPSQLISTNIRKPDLWNSEEL